MTLQTIVLSVVIALLVFSVSLDLKLQDFQRVARTPRAVIGGLIPQFLLLPVGTWLVTLALDLPPQIEVAMLLVAVCPGGTTSSFITHFGRGNAALSLSISAVGAPLSLLLTPLSFSWMVAQNPATSQWVQSLDIDPWAIWRTLTLLLALPLSAGLACSRWLPVLTATIRKPLSKVAVLALVTFVVANVFIQRHLLTIDVLPLLLVVILQNSAGLLFGYATAVIMRLDTPDRRAVVIEGGLQNVGFALGIVAVQFNSDLQMVIFTSLWGVWHSISALGLALFWRRSGSSHS
mgnify:CR=1 FL=1